MPVHTGELADFAIANNLFVINLNKEYNTPSGGQNTDLFKEVLAWLKPNSPVYGWEPVWVRTSLSSPYRAAAT